MVLDDRKQISINCHENSFEFAKSLEEVFLPAKDIDKSRVIKTLDSPCIFKLSGRGYTIGVLGNVNTFGCSMIINGEEVFIPYSQIEKTFNKPRSFPYSNT